MASAPNFPTHMDGGCRCGQVRYRIAGAPRFSFACHCHDCQQFSASAFSMGLVIDDGQFELMTGTLRTWSKIGSSGKPSVNSTCPVCGTWIHTRPQSQPGVTVLRPTSLDVHGWVRPVAQLFTRSALPWALLPVQFSYDTEFSDPEPIAKAFALGGISP